MASDLIELQSKVREFSVARDWRQFHSPKNLACAISVEAAELLENFQWMPEGDSQTLSEKKLDAVALEMGDIFIYLLTMSDRLKIDLVKAAEQKLLINESRYPIDKSKGRSDKYQDL